MSLTITGLIVGVLSYILKQVGIEADNAALEGWVTTTGMIGSALIIWFGRYRAGGITWYGARK